MVKYADELSKAANQSFALLSRSKQSIQSSYDEASKSRFSESLRSASESDVRSMKESTDREVEMTYGNYQLLIDSQQQQLADARQKYLDNMNNALASGASQFDIADIEKDYANEVSKITDIVKNAKTKWQESV